ncbi:MAG: TerC family protein [Bacteroidia bacterium]|nr:TerC family protein [Bacteroidia bacterium]
MDQIAQIFTIDGMISLLTLALLEIVLGIDNIIFISIIAGRLPGKREQKKARFTGLILALLMRVGLLFGITWIISMKDDLFTLFDIGFSGRDIILFCGGIFLLAKTVSEIHEKIESSDDTEEEKKINIPSLLSIILQIVLIDMVFSFDSILTAVGIVDNVYIMIGAVIISMVIMMIFAESVSDFINRHPTVKMLALAFLLMIGFLLVLESFDVHVPKPYVYSSMAFAFLVELLNMRVRRKKVKKSE